MERAFFLGLLCLTATSALGGFTITAAEDSLVFRFDKPSTNLSVVEATANNYLAPMDVPAIFESAARRKMIVPRFDGLRDRIYSGFAEYSNGVPTGSVKYVEIQKDISKYREPFPRTRSKKGLQVQWVEDAIALGVQHAAFNIDIGWSVKLNPAKNDLPWIMDGRTFWFNRGYIEGIDHAVKTMSDTGATVTLILLNYSHPGNPANSILQHPDYDPACPGHLSAFNTSNPESTAWLKAWMEFLADRYSAPPYVHGRVVNYIVGNEVNSHWDWANMGHVTVEQFTPDYLRAVRLCSMAVKKMSDSDRVYISLEHDWNKLFAEPTDRQGFPARRFIDLFNKLAVAGGNFDWNLAFHPYPEDLFQCRTWEDKSARPTPDSPRITFKNIQVLPQYFRRKELLYHGDPRHIILSEQGFHAKPTPEGERDQAAAYCYAWRKIVNLKGVDAFILHRQVDNAGEGGLNLGLWRRKPDSTCDPSTPRPMYDAFKYADTPEWKKHFQFALPVIGIRSWDDLSK